MRAKLISGMMLLLVAFVPIQSQAGNNDTIVEIYPCGQDIGLKMQTAGWVVLRTADIGQTNVNRFYALALTMFTASKRTGFFNNAAFAPIAWCGIPGVRRITTLGVKI